MNEVAMPWSGLTREQKIATLDAKALASPSTCFGAGQFYVVQIDGNPLFIPVESFDGFAAAFLGAE